MAHYNLQQLTTSYEELTCSAEIHARFTRTFRSGVPATQAGLEAYVRHHMRVPEHEINDAVNRIQAELLGADVAPSDGELKEQKVYAMNCFRRTPMGHVFAGDWQLKACIKQSASRCGLWMAKKGSKGDMSEAGRVEAIGDSLVAEPWQIVPFHPNGKPVETFFEDLRGNVSTPSGKMSICTKVESLAAGAHFSFRYRWGTGKLTEQDMVKVASMAMNMGLGSAKTFESGRFEILDMDINMSARSDSDKTVTKAKREKSNKVEEPTAVLAGEPNRYVIDGEETSD